VAAKKKRHEKKISVIMAAATSISGGDISSHQSVIVNISGGIGSGASKGAK